MTLRINCLDAQWVDDETSLTVVETSLKVLRPIISNGRLFAVHYVMNGFIMHCSTHRHGCVVRPGWPIKPIFSRVLRTNVARLVV